jgi:hypothetical protein
MTELIRFANLVVLTVLVEEAVLTTLSDFSMVLPFVSAGLTLPHRVLFKPNLDSPI